MRSTEASFDAIVIGGGPAGSTCAHELERGGFQTAIVDRALFPRDKVCAGWITPAVLEELDISPSEYRTSGRVLQPIHGFRVGILGARMHKIMYDEPVSYGIRRCELDDFLLARAPARKFLGHSVRSIERTDNGWRLTLSRADKTVATQSRSDETVVLNTPLLVGAGGHGCPVARKLSPPAADQSRLVVAQELEFHMTDAQKRLCAVEGDVPELFFTPDLVGYGWCFRKGDFINIGLGRLDREELRRHVEVFLEWLRVSGRIDLDLDLGSALKGHAYLVQGHEARTPVADRAVLVGDAAGLAYANSGEGIRPAIESAILAARVVREADCTYSRKALASYERELQAHFGVRPGRLSELLPAGIRTTVGRRLFEQRWFVRSVVLDRWFLRRRQGHLSPSIHRAPSAGLTPAS